jgi:predicted DNA-binding transcriptional regulator AlpA
MTDKRLKAAAVREICGDVSDMTIWRWSRERSFPEPCYIAGRRYWKEADVLDWLEAQTLTSARRATATEHRTAA